MSSEEVVNFEFGVSWEVTEMEISVCVRTYRDKPLEDALDILKSMGVLSVEVGAGAYLGKEHCDPSMLLADSKSFEHFRLAFERRKMKISAFSVHGNPLHPQQDIARRHHQDLIDAIDLASRMNVQTIVTYSGCPGDSDNARYPNWCFYPWPVENTELTAYQWDKKLVPYWKKIGAYAEDKGVKIALELQGSACVYSPDTMLRLRELTGQNAIGANLDPSHLWWQGIDPLIATHVLSQAGCLYYFHAKDIRFDSYNQSTKGLVDSTSFRCVSERAWMFCTIGYGHSNHEWAKLMATLRAVGYDGYISVEHEDALMSLDEGLRRGVENIKSVLMTEPAAVPPAFLAQKKDGGQQ